MRCAGADESVPFGGAVNEDRLGSAVKHFPYGEEPTTTDHDRVKFATYYRDATTSLDYADQRYYLRTIGRFLTADPYRASAGPAGPQSWNRYAYVQGDPVNFNDPTGAVAVLVSSHDEGVPTSWYPFGYFAAYYSLPHPGDPGPGGDPTKSIKPWQLGWEERLLAYRNRTFWAVHQLSSDCKERLRNSRAHIDGNALAATAQTITFWDARQWPERNLTQHEVVGNGVLTTLGETAVTAYAAVLPGKESPVSTHVVLQQSFFNTNPLMQNVVLIHEAMHIYTKLGDKDLADALHLPASSEEEASGLLGSWVANDCPRGWQKP